MTVQDEDAKLVTLARGAMGRAEAPEGAAVRDLDGRTYAGAPVRLAALQLTALQAAVAAAVSSGAAGFEAAVLVGGSGTPAALPQKALKERGYAGKYYQTHGVANADFLRVGGKDVEGTLLPAGPGRVLRVELDHG